LRDLSGYAFSPMRQGELTLYQGQGEGLKSILLVSPAGEPVPRRSLDRLDHELSFKGQLDPSWAALPITLMRRDDRPALILECPGSQLLAQILGKPLDVTRFLEIARPLTTTLRRVHEAGLIHKDIKPENVLLDVARGGVWLTGFGFASRLPRERQLPEPVDTIAGTLAYMAPEQTGRMNRPVDSRSDLYALGVTFYQMLVGELPFKATDPLEWVHCHVARQPISPKRRVSTVPEQISSIVMKLLSKAAEERYQTAAGVESDLRRCFSEWKQLGRIDQFSLGAYDQSAKLLIPERLYGRSREVDSLLASFDRVVRDGQTEFVLVSGYSGIGKSSIVNELHRVLVPARALFASGKFDQYQRDVPYVTLAQAFQSLIRPLLGKSHAELGMWRDSLREAVEPNGQLVVNLIPEFKLIIGEQPAVPDLPPQDAQSRFQLVFRRLLGCFARPEHPLVLFLDDLQWSDAATLDVIEDVLTQADVRHLMVIGAYRDNEVELTHPLMRKLQTIRNTKATVHEIVVKPLKKRDLEQLTADTVHCEREQAVALAQLLDEKTGGNPFFVVQFLTNLVEEELLTFDQGNATWTWDLPRIRARGFTDNIVNLMVGKLERLPATNQEAMKLFACVGNRATVETLSIVLGIPDVEIAAVFDETIRMGLIVKSESGFEFLHDRIQEAAYALVPSSDRAATHLRIGKLLAARMPANKIEVSIFDVVNQLNRGSRLIESAEERDRLAELNLVAGKRAQAAAAFASALTYFAAGEAMLDEHRFDRRFALAFELALRRGETEFLTGDTDSAEARLAELARRAEDPVDRAAVTHLQVTLYTALNQAGSAIEVGLGYLAQAGIAWPAHPADHLVAEEFERLWSLLGERSIEDLAGLPVMDDRRSRAMIDVLIALVPSSSYLDDKLASLIIGRTVRLSLENGISDGSCYAFVCIGLALGWHFGDYRSGYRFGKVGIDLIDASGEKHPVVREYIRGRTYFTFATRVMPWAKHLSTAIPVLRRAFEACSKIGDLTFASYACNNLPILLLAAGTWLDDVQREAIFGLEFCDRARIGLSKDILHIQIAFIRMLQGNTARFGAFDDSELDDGWNKDRFHHDPAFAIAACYYWTYKLQACVLADRYPEAIEATSEAERFLWANSLAFPLADFHFYGALSRTALHDAGSLQEQELNRSALDAHKRQIDAWADACHENFSDRAAIVAAEIARIEGRDIAAMRLYEEAVKLAHEHGFVQNEGIANELAARFYADRGFGVISLTYLRNARSCYARWGAKGKVRYLDQKYPQLREEPATTASEATPSFARLDIAALVEASRAISGELILDQLIEKLMNIVVEYAGADRGLLMLLTEEKVRIEAEATTHDATVKVILRQADAAVDELPESIVRTVVRTRKSIILGDAQQPNEFTADPYFSHRRPRSVLCLALVKQAQLIGLLYLENNLAPDAFTQQRISVLELLTSQAAISLETARLYAELIAETLSRQKTEEHLRHSEALLSQAQEIGRVGSWRWNVETDEFYWSKELFRIFGFGDQDATPSFSMMTQRVHPIDRPMYEQSVERATRDQEKYSYDYRIILPDGSIRFAYSVTQPLINQGGGLEFIGTVIDITERRAIEENLRTAQSDLARAARLTTMGELLATIAHEIKQPLASVVTIAETGVRWLDREPLDRGKVRKALLGAASAGNRAAEVMDSIRAMAKNSEPQFTKLDIKSLIEGILELVRAELRRHDIVVRMNLDAYHREIYGDRVQLQQVLLNLILNGVEAMTSVMDRARVLEISGALAEPNCLLIKIEDTGTGIDPELARRMFESFHTTKPHGLGLGLSICRSIIEAHGGRIWVAPRLPHGATLCFTVLTEKPA
jgi:PAS domain S-box-containing protein